MSGRNSSSFGFSNSLDLIPMFSVCQNCFKTFTNSSSQSVCILELSVHSPARIRLLMAQPSVEDFGHGPDRSQPNLLLTATGPLLA